MKTRKLVLIIADVLLLAVCILQGVLKAHDGARYFEFDAEPDEYTIVTPGESIHLVKEGDDWFINDQRYKANAGVVDQYTEAINYIRALDKVGTANEASLERYELLDGKKISVVVSKDGKQLRAVEIGKEATSGSQTYVTIDGGKDIYLAAGNLRESFDKTIETLRYRGVWNIDKNAVGSVMITPADGESWGVTRMGSGTDIAWNFTGAPADGIELDTKKASDWFDSVATIVTSSWYSDSTKAEDLGGNLIATAKVGYNFNTATISLYEIPAVTEDGQTNYYGTSSETPYVFALAKYQVDKFTKLPSELGL